MGEQARFWSGKRVLVTGAGGFIGSHLTEALVRRGAAVRALVHYNSRSDTGQLALLPARVRSALEIVAGDVRDPFFVGNVVQGREVVFHLAALIAIPHSYVAPESYFQTNLMGTLNVLEAARRGGVERVVHTSTSEVYGSALYTPIDEAHPLQAQSPYSASKMSADKAAESYWRAFQVPVVTVRPFNTYGPRQSPRAVLPSIVIQTLAREEVVLGSLEPVRDLTFVSDTVAGFLRAAQAEGVLGETINLGTGQGISIGELVELVQRVTGLRRVVKSDPARVRPATSEVYQLLCDNRKAAQTLGWAPRVELAQGVERMVAWYERRLRRYQPEHYYV